MRPWELHDQSQETNLMHLGHRTGTAFLSQKKGYSKNGSVYENANCDLQVLGFCLPLGGCDVFDDEVLVEVVGAAGGTGLAILG